ncbi:CBS domain protein [Mobiluncus curtisii subsp. curtisii ATCC 35241]|nr:CBS domain protein [Mobiluncus curtisii subsp. curtisii ATCC 35241]MCV0019953.1 CBS domain-containing protein [Mobiluncus curtisii]STY76546.1 putative manganese-dependent inorganic pyrophosphatase [Mobiluncus curtisii subsp. curtisii]NMW44109.1 CBS domain-containing protein [Mobiluncus curtisii]NMW45069.1 CBS domain-containing protein [Mobiluncus curtisii]
MFVKWRMTANPFTIDSGATVPDAIELMQTHGITKLPVLRDGKLCGVVSQLDLNRALPSDATSLSFGEVAYLLSKLKIYKIMRKNPPTIAPDAMLEEAAILMRDTKVEILPVLDEGKVVGVITESDVLDAFIDINGAREPGTRLVIEADDQPGVMSRLAGVTEELETNITHIAVYRTGMDSSFVLLGVNTVNTADLEDAFTKAGFQVRYVLRR